ncbi:MAG: polysaccharide biosynthesis C-terminal domain-containing protein [Paludibacteraceae bacterium]|nr:polysaccharide biosynthesis C-terminal domain-containing protein [Paludibacteraceae bacterium]
MSRIQLSDHFNFKRLLLFTYPSMLMVIFTSIYSIVDGVMVSNFVGTTPFAALNLIWPFVAVLGSIGFLLGTGGCALVAKTMGEGEGDKAKSIFSLLTYTALTFSVVLGVLGLFFTRDAAIFLGAEGEMVEHCVVYAQILLICLPTYVMQVYFQSFLIVAERPRYAMWVTIAAGVSNMVFDVVFIGFFDMGIAGAAWASNVGMAIGGFVPLYYFYKRKWLRRCHWDFTAIRKACSNGLSELVLNISLSLVSMLYMYQLIRQSGEDGVAAYGVISYFAFTFAALFIGYGIGVSPVVSYHYGAENKREMHSLLKKSMTIVVTAGIVIALIAQVLARPLSVIFVGYDEALLELTVHAFRIYSLHFIVTGINIFASEFFTALNNGPISALISLTRTLVLESGCVLLLPFLFGIEVIWWAVLVAETLAMLLSLSLIFKYRKRYGY